MCSNLLCAACGVCHSDLHVIKKDQPYPIPCVLGHEITGEVVEHGAHTDPATVQRFCAFFIPALLSNSPTHPSILQFVFATYLIPHIPTYPFFNFLLLTISFTSSFATYLIPHPPTHFALFLLLCISSQLAYSTTTASFGDDPVVAYIRTRIHRDLQLEILLFKHIVLGEF
jgi:hypothetical protein